MIVLLTLSLFGIAFSNDATKPPPCVDVGDLELTAVGGCAALAESSRCDDDISKDGAFVWDGTTVAELCKLSCKRCGVTPKPTSAPTIAPTTDDQKRITLGFLMGLAISFGCCVLVGCCHSLFLLEPGEKTKGEIVEEQQRSRTLSRDNLEMGNMDADTDDTLKPPESPGSHSMRDMMSGRASQLNFTIALGDLKEELRNYFEQAGVDVKAGDIKMMVKGIKKFKKRRQGAVYGAAHKLAKVVSSPKKGTQMPSHKELRTQDIYDYFNSNEKPTMMEMLFGLMERPSFWGAIAYLVGSILFYSRALDSRYLAGQAEEGRWEANISLTGSTAYLLGSTLFFEIPYNAYKAEALRVENLKALVREQVLPDNKKDNTEEEEDERHDQLEQQLIDLTNIMQSLKTNAATQGDNPSVGAVKKK